MNIPTLIKYIGKAKRSHKKSVSSQLFEIFCLRFSKGKLGISEYYDYGLFDDARFSMAQKREFVGWRMRFVLQNKLNLPSWGILSTDKLLFQLMMLQIGLPVPPVIGVFSRAGRYAGKIPVYDSAVGLKQFLEEYDDYPIFLKPVHAWHGRGGFGIQSCDVKNGMLVFVNGKSMEIDRLIDAVKNEPEGYIFQKYLVQHEELIKRCGNRLSTVRIWVLLTRNGPVIFRALWKVAVGDNMVDNTDHGKTGNLYGPVDVDTGLVKRQIFNAGFNEKEIRVHPDTGVSIVDFALPLWEEIKELVSKASGVFPGIKIQPWDVAITPTGPVLVELSVPGDIDGPQFAERRGLWDEAFNAALEES